MIGCASLVSYPPGEGRLGVPARDDPRFVLRAGDPFWAGGVTFELDTTAYIATFLVFSDGLVHAYWPYLEGQQREFSEGQHTVRPRRGVTFENAGPGFGAPVLFIVASDDSLHLAGLGRRVEGFEGGRSTYYKFGKDLRSTMEGLVRELVGDYAEPDWTAYYLSP